MPNGAGPGVEHELQGQQRDPGGYPPEERHGRPDLDQGLEVKTAEEYEAEGETSLEERPCQGRAEMPGAEGTQPVARPGSSPDVGRGET